MTATSAVIHADAFEATVHVNCGSALYSPAMTLAEPAVTMKITHGGVPMNSFNRTRDLRRCSFAPGILVIVCLVLNPVASAQKVYKCVDSENHIAFQQTPCQPDQRESEVAIKPPPAPPPPPPSITEPSRHRAISARDRAEVLKWAASVAPPAAAQVQSKPVVQSYECTTVAGEVFYTHSPCPEWVVDGSFGFRGASPHVSSVTGKPISRVLACKKMRSGARFASRLDQQTSTYDRNLGRDPCKNY